MTSNGTGLVLATEVAAILARHQQQACSLDLRSAGDDGMTLTLTFGYPDPASDYPTSLGLFELSQELQELRDMCQLRALAARYNIEPSALEALIRRTP